MARRLSILLMLAMLCGCLVDPVGPPEPDELGEVATITSTLPKYETLWRQAYRDGADKLESGVWKTDQQYRDGMGELMKAARVAAMQAMANREQAETAGVDSQGNPLWTPAKSAAYLRSRADEP